MKLAASLLTLAAASAFAFPLAYWPDAGSTLCVPDGQGGYREYSVQRPDRFGVPQTLAFDRTAQHGFCAVVKYKG